MSEEQQLGILFVARDQASATIERVHSGVQRVRTGSGAAGKALQAAIGAGVAAAITGGLSKLTSAAGEFEMGLAKVQNISSATAADMVILRDAAYEAALKTQFSPTEAVYGLEELASAGFRANEQVELLNQSLILAEAGGITIKRATATVATAVKTFALSAEDQTTMVDKMLKATNAFKLQAADLENGLAKTSGAVLTTNQSFDEMLLAVGLIKNVFPHAGESGNSVSRAMAGIANKADLLKKKLGIDVVDTLNGKIRPALDLFIELEEKSAEKMTNAAERAQFLDKVLGAFGKKGVAAAIGSLREEANKTGKTMQEVADSYRAQIAGAAGTGQAFRETLLATFQGQVNILRGSFETILVAVGEPLIKILQPVVKGFGEIVGAVARFIRDVPMELKKGIGSVVLIAASFTTVSFVAAAAVAVMTAFGGAFAAALVAVLPVVAAVGALGAAIYGFVRAAKANLGGFGDRLKGVFQDVKLLFQGVVQLFRSGEFSGTVMREMNALGNGGIKELAINIYALYHRARQFIGGVMDGFSTMKAVVGSSFSALGDAVRELFNQFTGLGNSFTDTANDLPSERFKAAGQVIGTVVARVVSVVVRGLAVLVNAYASVVRGVREVFDRFRGVFTALGGAITDMASELGVAVGTVEGQLGSGGDTIAGFAANAGRSLMSVIVIVARVATVVVRAVTLIIRVFNAMKGVVEFVGDTIRVVFDGVIWAIEKVIGGLVDVTSLADKAANALSYIPIVAGYNAVFGEEEEGRATVQDTPMRIVDSASRPEAAAAGPAAVSAAARDGGGGQTMDKDFIRQMMEEINIAVNVDGEVLARATAKAERGRASRQYQALPLEP